jgi:hypothetical protein
MKRLRGNMKRLALVGTLAAGLVIGLSTATASALPEGGFLSQTQTAHSANIYTYIVTWGLDAGPFLGGGTMNFDVQLNGRAFIQAGAGILKGTLAGCPAPVGPQGFTWTGEGSSGTGGPNNATNNPTVVVGGLFDAQVISNTKTLQMTLNLEGVYSPTEGTGFNVVSWYYRCGGNVYVGSMP